MNSYNKTKPEITTKIECENLRVCDASAIINEYKETKAKLFHRYYYNNFPWVLNYDETVIVNRMKRVLMDLIKKSIEELYRKDLNLISQNQSERSICARLAFIIQEALYINGINGYYSDVEIKRLDKDRLDNRRSTRTMNKSRKKTEPKIYCDILVHSRRDVDIVDNLIAIEMKVYGNSNIKSDIKRLVELTKPWPKPPIDDVICDTLLGMIIQIQKTQYKVISVERDEDGNQPSVGLCKTFNPFRGSCLVESKKKTVVK
jgi:hypothetical protein